VGEARTKRVYKLGTGLGTKSQIGELCGGEKEGVNQANPSAVINYSNGLRAKKGATP